MKPTYKISSEAMLPAALDSIESLIKRGLQAGPATITIGRPTRSLDQNSKLWPMLTDISRQVEWHGQKLKPEDWKDLFTAALTGQKCVAGIDGGLVFFGSKTSKMSKSQFSELIEYIYSFGAERGVNWSEAA